MILISIFLILLLLGVALWLWYLSQAQLTHFAVLMTKSNMTVKRSVSKLSFPRLKEVLSLLRLRSFYLRPKMVIEAEQFLRELKQAWSPGIEIEDEQFLRELAEAMQPGRLRAPLTTRYFGTANLPKKVYEGSSQNITLILNRQDFVQGLWSEVSRVQEITKNKQTEQQITLDIQEKDSSEQFLEVRLLAAAFPTKGEEKQRQSLTRERLEYRWNCYFQAAGRHELALELKVVHLSEERSIGVIEQQIRVVKLDHMTQFHVQVAAVLLGTIGLVSTVVTIISNIMKLGIP